MSSSDEPKVDASKAMLTAALGGLLCFAACVTSEHDGPTSASSGSTSAGAGGSKAGASSTSGSTVATSSAVSASTSGAGGAASSNSASSSATATGTAATSTTATGQGGGGPTNPHTPIPDTKCPSGVVPNPMITSSTVGMLTQADFTALCNQAGGIFEVQPLCGGSNACRGFTYDSGTQTLIQHTCQATNSCAGYSCVVCG